MDFRNNLKFMIRVWYNIEVIDIEQEINKIMKIVIESDITDDLEELKEKITNFFFYDLDLEISFEEQEIK